MNSIAGDTAPVGHPGPCECVPWWKGVAAMDPQLPVTSIRHAAALAATALAIRYLRLEPRGSRVFGHRPPEYRTSADWEGWLASANGPMDFLHRRQILWQLLENQDADPAEILPIAEALYVNHPLPAPGGGPR